MRVSTHIVRKCIWTFLAKPMYLDAPASVYGHRYHGTGTRSSCWRASDSTSCTRATSSVWMSLPSWWRMAGAGPVWRRALAEGPPVHRTSTYWVSRTLQRYTLFSLSAERRCFFVLQRSRVQFESQRTTVLTGFSRFSSIQISLATLCFL
jgi:hypothetical protein